jgi:DNA-binding CsgD family transcriptional regulator
MESLNALTRGQVESSPVTPQLVSSAPVVAGDEGIVQGSDLSAALEASLRLTASLLDQCGLASAPEDLVIDVDLGGYHWSVSRCIQIPPDSDARLSPREVEIARMVAVGSTNRSIASALEISPWTVATHLRRIFGKLGVNSRAAMVAQVVELGLYPGLDDVPDR